MDCEMIQASTQPPMLPSLRLKQPSLPTLSTHSDGLHSSRDLILNASVADQRRLFKQVQGFAKMYSSTRERSLQGVVKNVGLVDLVIADLPEGVPIPNVSSPSSIIPSWNAKNYSLLQDIFDFVDEILHDDGTMLLFYPDDNGEYQDDFESFYTNFGFHPYKEWLGVNLLPLRSTKIQNVTTNRFKVLVLKRVLKSNDAITSTTMKPFISKFYIRDVPELLSMGVQVNLNDTLINLCTSPIMNGSRPWRGPCEKDECLHSTLILSMTDPGDVVVDVAVGIGNSIRACQHTGRHIVAFEEDKQLLDAVLEPLKSNVMVPLTHDIQNTALTSKKVKRAPAVKRPRTEDSE